MAYKVTEERGSRSDSSLSFGPPEASSSWAPVSPLMRGVHGTTYSQPKKSESVCLSSLLQTQATWLSARVGEGHLYYLVFGRQF